MAAEDFPRTVTIYGTGLIGSSLGLAFRERIPGIHVYGVDSPEVLSRARQVGAVEEGPKELSDLTVLAAPVGAILDLLGSLSRSTGLIIDVGSTKAQVCGRAAQLGLPFVGGHPMTGSERSGPEAASAAILRNAPFFLCPIPSTPPKALELLKTLVQTIGAHPIVLDAAEHDRLVARTSHLPQLLSTVLAGQTASDRELAGPGLKSLTRLAASPFHVWRDILDTSGFLPEELESFIQRLEQLLAALKAHNVVELERFFQLGNRAVNHEQASDD
jgi:prephenate dehydrogenase